MEGVEFVINGEEFVAIGYDPRILPVYCLLGGTRQLTNMRWLGMTRFVSPDSCDVEGDLMPREIRERYGTALPPPYGVRLLEDDRGVRDFRPRGQRQRLFASGQ